MSHHYCEICNISILTRNKNKHEKSKEHVKKLDRTENKKIIIKDSNLELSLHYINEICEKILYILRLTEHNDMLIDLYEKIIKISVLFPPKKNENKFIYGGLIEYSIIKSFRNILECKECIDNGYKYDYNIYNVNFSIKVIKQKSKVIIINKNNKKEHNLDNMAFMICNITEGKLYIFVYSEIYKSYIKDDISNISFNSSIFKILEEQNLYINFPKNIIHHNYNEIDIYEMLYNNFIRSN